MVFPVKKRKSQYHPGIWHICKYKISAEIDNFKFLYQIYPKRVQQNKATSPINYKRLLFVPSASPKLLNLNQGHLSKK